MNERLTVQAFAVAVARLVDPFASRAAVLEAMGIDEAAWRELDVSWRAEMQRRAGAGDRSIVHAFKAAFARERERIVEQRRVAPRSAGGGRAPAGDLDKTAMAEVVLEPALPFAGTGPPPPPAGAVTLQDGDLDQTAVIADDDALGLTLPFDEDR